MQIRLFLAHPSLRFLGVVGAAVSTPKNRTNGNGLVLAPLQVGATNSPAQINAALQELFPGRKEIMLKALRALFIRISPNHTPDEQARIPRSGRLIDLVVSSMIRFEYEADIQLVRPLIKAGREANYFKVGKN